MTRESLVDRLVFVYDADATRWSAFVDSARKLLMLNGCALCRITHGLAGEKEDWKSCKEELGVPVDYVHRDQIEPDLKGVVGEDLPAIVAVAGTRRVLLLNREVLERCKGSVGDLKGRLSYHAAMKNLVLRPPSGGAARTSRQASAPWK